MDAESSYPSTASDGNEFVAIEEEDELAANVEDGTADDVGNGLAADKAGDGLGSLNAGEDEADMAPDEGAPDNLAAAIEAMLFVSDEPVAATTLADILEVSPGDAEEALAELAADYRDNERGIQLREVAGGWRFYTHPAYHAYIEKYVLSWDTHKLSQAALEALAVIAYHQPVTRAGVNAIRGVNSEGVISSLVEKGLVREAGREKGPGAAILYATTRTFLEKFGLRSLKELPPLEDFAPDEESKKLIRERLSAGPMSSALEVEGELEDDLIDADGEGGPKHGAGEAPADASEAMLGASQQASGLEEDQLPSARRTDDYPDMPVDNLGDTLDDDDDDNDFEEVE